MISTSLRMPALVATSIAMLAVLSGSASQRTSTLTVESMNAASQALLAIPAAIDRLNEGDYADAQRRFEVILNTLPSASRAHTAARALGYPSAQDYRREVSALWNNLGLGRLRGRQYDAAEVAFAAAIQSDPLAAAPHSNLGVSRLTRRDYRGAVQAFNAARDRADLGARGYLHLGRAHLGLGDHSSARWALHQSVRRADDRSTPESWGTRLEAQRALARVDIADGRLPQARARLEAILLATNGDCEARYVLLQLSATTAPTEVPAHRSALDACRDRLASIQSILAASPGRVAAIRWLGDAYRQLGLYHLAAVRYRQLLARDPADHEARLALIKIHQRLAPHGNPPAPEHGVPQ